MRPRYGLTLFEVLLASAILALIAVACLPVMQKALADLAEPKSELFQLDELGEVADRFLFDPSKFGIATTELLKQGAATIEWPTLEREGAGKDDGALSTRPSISIRCITSNDPEINHAWVVFECADQFVSCWVALPPPPNPPPPLPAPAKEGIKQ